MNIDATEHPKLQALSQMVMLAETVPSDLSPGRRQALAHAFRDHLKTLTGTPNLYDLSTDIASINSFITELTDPKSDAADVLSCMHGRLYSLRMRVSEMLRDEGGLSPASPPNKTA